jgi:hypothetical protein
MHPSWFSREVVYRGLVNSASKRRLGLKQEGAGRSPDWLKMKNPEAPAVKREAEEDWGRERGPETPIAYRRPSSRADSGHARHQR